MEANVPVTAVPVGRGRPWSARKLPTGEVQLTFQAGPYPALGKAMKCLGIAFLATVPAWAYLGYGDPGALELTVALMAMCGLAPAALLFIGGRGADSPAQAWTLGPGQAIRRIPGRKREATFAPSRVVVVRRWGERTGWVYLDAPPDGNVPVGHPFTAPEAELLELGRTVAEALAVELFHVTSWRSVRIPAIGFAVAATQERHVRSGVTAWRPGWLPAAEDPPAPPSARTPGPSGPGTPGTPGSRSPSPAPR